MVWRIVSLILFIAGILAMPLWPYSRNWSVFAPGFCWFLAVLAFLISVFARRGSKIWKHRGQG
ncbi:MAG: DUF3309 domain-containing protein [Acidobacteriota bacterium]|nr:DUF3309 domain-containing protein [Acidobacteriota bacterium]